MSIVEGVEDEIVKVLAVYSTYRRLILGDFARFLMTPQAIKIGSKQVLRENLESSLLAFTERLLQKSADLTSYTGKLLLETAIQPEDRELISDQDLDVLDEFMEASVGRMEKAIVGQMQADVHQIMETYQRFLVRVYMAARASNLESAAFYERNKVSQNVDLYHRDALGRRRDSEQFVFTELRYGIYRWFNISMVYILSKLGRNQASIDRPNTHLNGVVIDLEDFDDLEGQVFHPNAKALLVP